MTVTIMTGDCRDRLKELPDESVQCVVTSPPYYGLRDYGHGDQIGLEETPEQYVAAMVDVFREVRRVLREDGVVWLNIGDSYAANRGYQVPPTKWKALDFGPSNAGSVPDGLKPKDLIGIPWRLAFALQADGWWLRSDVIEEVELYCPCGCGHVMEERIWRYSQDRDGIWHKPNPMPESVTDRPTKAHEYVFLLSKAERYFYDHEAIKEPGSGRIPNNKNPQRVDQSRNDGGLNGIYRAQQRPQTSRNKRSVWTIATKPFSEAHFAVMPPDLVEPCIKAGSREGDTVLDPFGGAGTVGLVADRLKRDAILVELNEDYAEMARRRIVGDAPLLTDVRMVGE